MSESVQTIVVPTGQMEVRKLAEYPEANIYVFIPDSYSPDRPIGLFFFMHGGDRDTPATAPYTSYLNPESGRLFQFVKNIPFITVAPSALPAVDGKRWNRCGVIEYVETVISAMQKWFHIDADRMILGGHSMGGFGAYHVGSILADRFAGIWCSSGAWLKADFRSFLGTPVYIAHGKFDCAANYHEQHVTPRHHDWCSVDFARAAHELMLRDDVAHVYDEHQGGHGFAWESNQQAMRRFFAWAARQKRQAAPARCAVITPRGSSDPDLEMRNHSRYLTIEATTPGDIELDEIVLTGPNVAWTLEEFEAQSFYLKKHALVGAALIAENLGDNHFTFEAHNVSTFTLFLNSDMVDCTQKVTLTINGVSRQFLPQPSTRYADYTHEIRVDGE